ncbi:uncharacterized protein UV8b_00352 [Ustilaginoidea virens]|uniref:DUF952 domain protein n=1 Tax=Ustilaginoidea virens TaxID=1159556 RepID=A0A8E5MDF6_USTVR|nr:uncharacterized protein UV8b_00352 [Ustilaginoidea virens]QUC16111.1 hypothetical protein UV8b_00352 [Ustilaginoidea virens]
MSASSPHRYVYKIVPSPPPDTMPEQFPLSELDQKDGFVHLSTGEQIPLTCDRFFKNASSLWVFKFELARFSDTVRWEGGFPHLYGNFGVKDILAVQRFERAEGGNWPEAMRGSQWLE